MTFQPINPETLKAHVERGKAFEYDGKGGMNLSPARPDAGSWKPAPNPHVWDCRDIPGMYMKKDDKAYKWAVAKKTPAENKPRSKRGSTCEPQSQNAHMHAMRKDLKYDAFGVGMVMHIFCYLPSNKGKAVMSMSRIADECGCSEATARRHMKTLVERGWFQRVDNGKGSVKGTKTNIATYTPSMPSWHRDAS